jgi:ERCC4-type nuclease
MVNALKCEEHFGWLVSAMPEIFKPKIFVDARESLDVKEALAELECEVVEETLTPADYVVSEDCAVERKELHDFFRSVFDGRLFEQAERLAAAYANPCLLVEGDVIRAVKAIQNPMAFLGALARVMADHNISVIFTPDAQNTAMFLRSLATKLQGEAKRRVAVKQKPSARNRTSQTFPRAPVRYLPSLFPPPSSQEFQSKLPPSKERLYPQKAAS